MREDDGEGWANRERMKVNAEGAPVTDRTNDDKKRATPERVIMAENDESRRVFRKGKTVNQNRR